MALGRFGAVLLRVWREASGHREIEVALGAVASLLAERLPLAQVIVRRLDSARGAIETIGSWTSDDNASVGALRSELSPAELTELNRWLDARQIEAGGASDRKGPLRSLLPAGLTGDVLVGPLATAGHAPGVLIVATSPGEHFAASHQRAFRLLLDPFSAWLENDHWRRELSALREAAEADKRSLLARLGRTTMNEPIIGAARGLKSVIQGVDQVSRTHVPVLILGETGSGKEVIARAIHERSPRAGGPFLRVNCGAISPELVDSELFGHERGSFTGAQAQRKGWFERADGGTLFLDECGELSLPAQVRLLRILQDGMFERVGGERPVHVDVRIVAATHRNLEEMVREGRFRQDLWYRIAVFPLRLPPLRDRLEDIAEMAQHFASKSVQRLGMPKVELTEEDIRLLNSYDWPGNVRELAAVIERAVILSSGGHLDLAKALGPLPAATARSSEPAVEVASPKPNAGPFTSLDEAMVRHIEDALARTLGRIEGPFGAASLLDINPHTLRGRMRSLGIEWRRFRKSHEA